MASSLDSDSEGSRDATEDSRDRDIHGHDLLLVGEGAVSPGRTRRVNRLRQVGDWSILLPWNHQRQSIEVDSLPWSTRSIV
jgi:hypothetical protein